MSTAVIWSKSKPGVEFQYGGRLGEFNGMLSQTQSHVSHRRALPLGEFTVMFPEPHATLQAVRNPSALWKIVFRHILFFCYFNAVWALTIGGFRIVSDTLVLMCCNYSYATCRASFCLSMEVKSIDSDMSVVCILSY